MKPVIIDYDIGNIFSIISACKYLGVEPSLSRNKDSILEASHILLPGVGAFQKAMCNLEKYNLIKVVKAAANEKKIPILGICLGMQLMAKNCTEGGYSEGLGLIDMQVDRFILVDDQNLKIPHVGFNSVKVTPQNKLYQGLGEQPDFYFTHSYRILFESNGYASGTCKYGETFIASFEKENIFGTQFHPEKSQTNGLIVLKNFFTQRIKGA
jgi:imidazole glycerol-phosphate synthase subunit HisH